MRITMKLTLDGLLRALTRRGDRLAEKAEADYLRTRVGRKPVRREDGRARAPRRGREGHDGVSGD